MFCLWRGGKRYLLQRLIHIHFTHAISRVKAGACSFPSKLKVNCDNNLKLFINTSCSRTTRATMSLTWSSRPRRQSAITAVLIIVAVSSRRSVTADEKSASHMAAKAWSGVNRGRMSAKGAYLLNDKRPLSFWFRPLGSICNPC